MDRRYDLAIALLAIAFGVFVIAVARTIPIGLHKDAVGPRAFFFGIGVTFVLGGCIVATQRLRYWKAQKDHMVRSEGTDDEEGFPASFLRAASVIGISFLSIFFLEALGYLISTPLFIIGAMLLLGERNWKMVISLAVGFTALFYVVFGQWLDVSIPVGPFTALFRNLGWIPF